jgi:hypothetical protein
MQRDGRGMNAAAWQTEALRQQMLVRALWGDARPAVVGGWLRDAAPHATRGLQAYRANAGALAERALAAAFPTVQQLVGEAAAFGALARAFWHADAPQCGDIAQWGGALPAFIGASAQLAPEPYLADAARLDWAVHCAEQAADGAGPVSGLERLADTDPAHLRLQLAPGTALVSSAHPVVTIWQAHRSDAGDRFEAVRAAFARGAGEHALVHRIGFKAVVAAVTEAEVSFMQALIEGHSLGHAITAAGARFDFEPWLLTALQEAWLAAVEVDSHIQPGHTR